MIIRPQPGPQEAFLSTAADICIFGGAAGGGKSYVLLMEPLRHSGRSDFGSVIFRRMSTQITGEGGLWDTTRMIYPEIGAKPFTQPRLGYKFQSGSKVSFAHLQFETDVNAWQGSQIPLIGFDELTHFTEYQFFYMMSRNRSVSGVRPYIRATTNPDADSWVARFIAYWIDQQTGFPISERAGKLRYFTRLNGAMMWGDSPSEVAALAGIPDAEARDSVKSVTFIPSKLDDNKILMARDPSYKASLMALPKVERERLLGGNWKVRPEAGEVFPRDLATIIHRVPENVVGWVRRWDLASTTPSESNPDPDATCSVLMGATADGKIIIADVTRDTINSVSVRKKVKQIAREDRERYGAVKTIVPQDPGQAGKEQAESYVTELVGFDVGTVRETGSKEIRANLLAAQWQAGKVYIVNSPRVEKYVEEMDGFPKAKHDDAVDASSGAFIEVSGKVSSLARFRVLAA